MQSLALQNIMPDCNLDPEGKRNFPFRAVWGTVLNLGSIFILKKVLLFNLEQCTKLKRCAGYRQFLRIFGFLLGPLLCENNHTDVQSQCQYDLLGEVG